MALALLGEKEWSPAILSGDLLIVQQRCSSLYGKSDCIPGQDYTSKAGLNIKMINGEPHFNVEEVQQMIVSECSKMAAETRPIVKSAQDARKIVDELVRGLGGDFESFRASTKLYLEDIRQTRFAVVTETSSMTNALKEIRQFFIGSDYKEQTQRLREFVDLCERLKALKDSGFLDSVADTMLRLAEK
jgi:hypothetical protein